MKASDTCLRLIKEFEGFSSVPYQDVGGLWTVGYGHLLRNGEWYDAVSEEDATELLRQDVTIAEDDVIRMVTVKLNQNQFDALVSFFYNIGSTKIEGSRTLGYINREEFDKVPGAMLSWNKVGGKPVRGLTKRRMLEGRLFAEEVNR